MPMLLGLAQILLVGLVVFLSWLIAYTFYALTHPARKSYAWAIARNVPGDPGECDQPYGFESFDLAGQRGKIECWRISGKNPNAPVVIMTHGWGSSKQGGLKRLAPIVDHAREVIMWDLPGHGESDGICALGSREHHDLIKILDTIALDIPIVLFGWSMGSGVCIKACAEMDDPERIVGIICESPYIHAITPARNVMRLRGFVTRINLPIAMKLLSLRFGLGFGWNGFARDELVRSFGSIKILIVHGEQDPICPIADAQRLAELSEAATLVPIEHGGHNNLWVDDQLKARMAEAVGGFMESVAQR